MLVSEMKTNEEILNYLKDEKQIFIVGCNGCAGSSGTGDEKQVQNMKKILEEKGKFITGAKVVDFLCEKALIKSVLMPYEQQIMQSDSILVMTCGVGVQAVASSVMKPVHPACNTLSMGGARGEWTGIERCGECGDCVLEYTAGICPMTKCQKKLLNGACGGSHKGKCEVADKECGWSLIYERLKSLGKLDKLYEYVPPKTFSKLTARNPELYKNTSFSVLDAVVEVKKK